MAELIGVVGDTGTGKSYSLRNLNEKETFIISVTNKSLMFPSARKKYSAEQKNFLKPSVGKKVVPYEQLTALLKAVNEQKHIKNIVLDDFQYLMSGEFMDRSEETGWGKFTTMAKNVYELIMQLMSLREDLFVFILTHDEVKEGKDYKPIRKIKTIGNLLDDKITLEGLFNYILFTDVNVSSGKSEYRFRTQSDGIARAKSAPGVLEAFEGNDLKIIEDKIRKYLFS